VAESPIAVKIADGHAFEKHVRNEGQFPGILTREQFASAIQRLMDNPSASKRLARDRTAYWDDTTDMVVICDPHTTDGGTAFKPRAGRSYYENLQ
jgi:hypothetical protein